MFSRASFAAPVFHDVGPNLSDNGASGAWSSLYATRNPAAGELSIGPESTFRMGLLLSSIGLGAEVGPVDNFAEEIDDLIDALDREHITLSEGNALVNRFNGILGDLSKDGYVKLHAGAQAPFFPILIRSGIGVFTLDANIAGQARLGFLDAPLTYNAVTEELETASAVYVKGAQVTEFSLGFSRPVWRHDAGQVIVGGSVRYLRAALSKQVIGLESVEDDEDVEDIVSDAYDANERTSNAVTVDLGAIYSTPRYRIGLTLANLTEPEFEYGAIGVNCGALTGNAQHNCFTAAYYGDRIALHETWTLERLATVEGALLFADGAGSLSASLDLNEVHDPVGDLNKNVHLALGYKTATSLLPDVRVGYRKNLAGSKLSSASLGFTFFGRMHLDFACGLENTEVDGSSVPRTLAINLGFEMSY